MMAVLVSFYCLEEFTGMSRACDKLRHTGKVDMQKERQNYSLLLLMTTIMMMLIAMIAQYRGT